MEANLNWFLQRKVLLYVVENSVPIRNVGWKLLRIEKTKMKGVSMV